MTNPTTMPAAKASMLIRKSVSEVFGAFIDPAITSQFWFSRGSGRLDEGKPVTWYWDEYNVSAEITPQSIIKDKQIIFTWPAPGDITTTVEMTFSPRGGKWTFLSVEEKGWNTIDEKIVEMIVGQTQGWTLVLTGLKAWLEYGIQLNLVADHAPDAAASHKSITQ